MVVKFAYSDFETCRTSANSYLRRLLNVRDQQLFCTFCDDVQSRTDIWIAMTNRQCNNAIILFADVNLFFSYVSDDIFLVSGQLPEWTPSRKTQSRRAPSRMNTIPNGHHLEWTRSRMDTIPNEHNPEWTPSRMDTIPNGHIPKWILSRMDTIPNGYYPEWHHSEWILSRKDTIPNEHHPEWTPSRMDTIPNGHHPEWTLSRVDTIPSGHYPEWTLSRMDGHNSKWTQSRMDANPNGTILNEHLHSYLIVVYVCWVRTFYKNAFNKKLIFCVM